MKKRTVLIFGIVISILFVIILLYLSPKMSKEDSCSSISAENSEAIQTCCNEWSIENNISYFNTGWGGTWKIKNGTCVWTINLPPEPGPLHWCIYPAGQTNKTKDELVQECCNEWAIENEIGHVKCAGKWEYNGGYECKYVCFEY